jgi:hypothetical protein
LFLFFDYILCHFYSFVVYFTFILLNCFNLFSIYSPLLLSLILSPLPCSCFYVCRASCFSFISTISSSPLTHTLLYPPAVLLVEWRRHGRLPASSQ